MKVRMVLGHYQEWDHKVPMISAVFLQQLLFPFQAIDPDVEENSGIVTLHTEAEVADWANRTFDGDYEIFDMYVWEEEE